MKVVVLWTAAALLAGALLAPQSAWAQDETWKKDRFYVGLGLYRPDFKTRVRVDDLVKIIPNTFPAIAVR